MDPHLDVRPLENECPHSGSPFRQILESKELRGKNFVEFGTRACRNARSHYEYCLKKGVRILTLETLRVKAKSMEKLFAEESRKLAKASMLLGATFDMDSCQETEGVSAAPVLGFTAWELCRMASIAGAEKKVHYFEIAEVAPSLDTTERSSRIAAEMIHSFLCARALSRKRR